MYYAMQVGAGQEERISSYCDAVLSDTSLGSCFAPHYETQMKLGGRWQTVQRILFPGYVFFLTEDADALADRLTDILGLPEALHVGTGREIFPLLESEVRFLDYAGGHDHLMEMSVGAIEGTDLTILSGPLREMDPSRIVKIDRHKRRATLAMDLFGGTRNVQVGLEVKTKTA